jgi:acyl carrier protein
LATRRREPKKQVKMTIDYTKQLREFVVNNFMFGNGTSLSDDTSFLNAGIVDSTGILELILHLEETYSIKIQPEEMVPENLDSIGQVAGFLRRKGCSA